MPSFPEANRYHPPHFTAGEAKRFNLREARPGVCREEQQLEVQDGDPYRHIAQRS